LPCEAAWSAQSALAGLSRRGRTPTAFPVPSRCSLSPRYPPAAAAVTPEGKNSEWVRSAPFDETPLVTTTGAGDPLFASYRSLRQRADSRPRRPDDGRREKATPHEQSHRVIRRPRECSHSSTRIPAQLSQWRRSASYVVCVACSLRSPAQPPSSSMTASRLVLRCAPHSQLCARRGCDARRPRSSPDTVSALRTEVDELVCLETPEPFVAVVSTIWTSARSPTRK
jgi:hypothetical protein